MFETVKSFIVHREADDAVRAALLVRVARFAILISLMAGAACKEGVDVSSQRSSVAALCVSTGSCDAQRPAWYLQDPGKVTHTLVANKGFVAKADSRQQVQAPSDSAKTLDLGTGSMIFAPFTGGSAGLGDKKNSQGRFLRQVSDSDRLLIENLNASGESTEQNQVVLSSRALTLGRGELLIVRHAVAVEIDTTTREACKGTVFSTGIQATQNGVAIGSLVAGSASNFGSNLIRITGAAATAIEVQDGGQYTIEVVASTNKSGCQLKILEPATLTVFVFSPFEYLELFAKSAKFLLGTDLGDESAVQSDGQPLRVNTVESGPPIRTLKRKDFNLGNGDAVVVVGSITASADDRVGETSAWLQVMRSPSGLSSNLNVATLPTDGSERTMSIIDWADANLGSGKVRFYLNFMGSGVNAKPVTIGSQKLALYHFGSMNKEASVSVPLAMTIPVASPEIPTGRWVDLFLIRSKMTSTRAVPPPEDGLVCHLFNAGRGAGTGAIQGIIRNGSFSIPTPIHHHFQTRWVGGSISFSLLVYENIYHQAPVWTLEPPKDRESHYTRRFYEVNVSNPGQVGCRAIAVKQ